MTDDIGCVVCGGLQETINHVLRDCDFAYAVWLKFLFTDQVRVFFELSYNDWLIANLEGKFRFNTCAGDFDVMFAMFVWLLWKNRNNNVFQGTGG